MTLRNANKIIGYGLGKNHHLAEHGHKGFVKVNFCTLVIIRRPILSFPKFDFNIFGSSIAEKDKIRETLSFSKHLIASLTRWIVNKDRSINSKF